MVKSGTGRLASGSLWFGRLLACTASKSLLYYNCMQQQSNTSVSKTEQKVSLVESINLQEYIYSYVNSLVNGRIANCLLKRLQTRSNGRRENRKTKFLSNLCLMFSSTGHNCVLVILTPFRQHSGTAHKANQ